MGLPPCSLSSSLPLTMPQIELSPFARRYMEELKSLVNIDRHTISFLRNLAAENHEQEKFHIAVAFQQYLYHECPPKQQLPLLYLIDCILKTDTEHYLHALCPPLPAMFRRVWQTSPDLHPKLTKLAHTWRPYLPLQTQAEIDQILASTASAPIIRGMPFSVGQGPAPALAAPAPRYPYASSADPRLAPPQAHLLQQRQQQQQQQQHSMSLHFSGAPASSASPSIPLQPVSTTLHAPPNLHEPLTPAAPMQLLVLAQPPNGPGGTAPAGLTQPLLPLGHMPLPIYPTPQQPASTLYLQQQGPQQQSMPRLNGNMHQNLQQQQQQQQQQYNQVSYTHPSAPGPQPQPQPLASASHPSSAVSVSSSQDIMSALHSLVSSMNAAEHKSHGAGAAAEMTTASQPPAAPRLGKVSGSRSFHSSVVKETDQSAIDALLDISNQTRTSFLDLRFLRTRRIRSAVQSGQQQCQPWYYPVDKWMLGVSAEEQEATAEGLWKGDEDEEAAAVDYNVEEDPSQPECAISGEPFDRWYDPDTDKWFYQGAVILTGEAAARHGIMDGSIVKVHCLAGEPTKVGMAARGLGAATGSSQPRAADLPLPASKPPASPSPPPPAACEQRPSPPPSSPPPAAAFEQRPSPPPSSPPPAVAAATTSEAAAAGAAEAAAGAEGVGMLQALDVGSSAAAPGTPQSPPHSLSPTDQVSTPISASTSAWGGGGGGAQAEGCAVAALRLEPHADDAAQHVPHDAGGERFVKRALEDGGDLSATVTAAINGAALHMAKKIKLEFSQAV